MPASVIQHSMPPSAAVSQRSGDLIVKFLMFGMMALYGPTIAVLGQLRYVEIALIGIMFLNARNAFMHVDRITAILIQLFLLTAACQLISDAMNGAHFDGTAKRVGSYLILIVLILATKFLGREDFSRMRWILAGYAISWIFLYFIGTESQEGYQVTPWRLGMGYAATLGLCVIVSLEKGSSLRGGIALLLLAGLHVVLGSRSIAIFTAIAGLGTMWTTIWGRPFPRQVTITRIVVILGGIILATVLTYQAVVLATNARLFPQELQQRMQQQVDSPYGLLATARPETAAATMAILKKPLLGFGSTAYDNDVWGYYVDIYNSNFLDRGNYVEIYKQVLYQQWDTGLPSHSHLFGAWVDAGIFAALCWFMVLFLSFYILVRALSWNSRYTALLLFISSLTIWDVLFSPGPHRMDVALRVMILTFALREMRAHEALFATVPENRSGSALSLPAV
jgi:hypothetical protein